MSGMISKGASIFVLGDAVRFNILGSYHGGLNQVSFIERRSTKTRGVESLDWEKTLNVLRRDI